MIGRARSGPGPDGTLAGPVWIVASPFKTATTTVGQALIDLGVGRRDMGYRGSLLQAWRKTFDALNREIGPGRDFAAFAAARGATLRAELAPLAADLAGFDVFSDAPVGHGHLHPFVWKILAPEARFIWVARPRAEWIASARHWEETHPETYPRHVLWQTDPARRERQLVKRRRLRRTRFDAIAAACPSDCLVLPIAALADYRALAAFCGVPAPEGPMRRQNVSGR